MTCPENALDAAETGGTVVVIVVVVVGEKAEADRSKNFLGERVGRCAVSSL